MDIHIDLKDPRFCISKTTDCPCRRFGDWEQWCTLGYWKCNEMGNSVFDIETNSIVATNVDFNDDSQLKDEWFGPDGRRYDWVVMRPQKCIDDNGE